MKFSKLVESDVSPLETQVGGVLTEGRWIITSLVSGLVYHRIRNLTAFDDIANQLRPIRLACSPNGWDAYKRLFNIL